MTATAAPSLSRCTTEAPSVGSVATPHVVGVDLSLTSTGVACNHGVLTIATTGRAAATLPQRAARLQKLRDDVLDWCRGADLVVIEGPSFASQHGSQHDRAGLWWLIVQQLIARDIPVAAVAPTQRAKYATGKGNAPKDMVLAAVVRRFPTFDVNGNDQADALILAAMGLEHLGWPLVVMPDAHRTAMHAVAWPDREVAA